MAPVVEKAPTHCPNGHRLGPNRSLVSFTRCTCDRVPERTGGHITWTCRTCGSKQYSDEHTDDDQLLWR